MSKKKRNPITLLSYQHDGAHADIWQAGYVGDWKSLQLARERLRTAKAGKTKVRKANKVKRKQKHR